MELPLVGLGPKSILSALPLLAPGRGFHMEPGEVAGGSGGRGVQPYPRQAPPASLGDATRAARWRAVQTRWPRELVLQLRDTPPPDTPALPIHSISVSLHPHTDSHQGKFLIVSFS